MRSGQPDRRRHDNDKGGDMAKTTARDLDNLMRLIATLPGEESAKLLGAVKKESDPDEKKKMIEHALKKKGLKPL